MFDILKATFIYKVFVRNASFSNLKNMLTKSGITLRLCIPNKKNKYGFRFFRLSFFFFFSVPFFTIFLYFVRFFPFFRPPFFRHFFLLFSVFHRPHFFVAFFFHPLYFYFLRSNFILLFLHFFSSFSVVAIFYVTFSRRR